MLSSGGNGYTQPVTRPQNMQNPTNMPHLCQSSQQCSCQWKHYCQDKLTTSHVLQQRATVVLCYNWNKRLGEHWVKQFKSTVQIIGVDFHRAMMVIVPGEKLLIVRRPVRNWTQLQFFPRFTVDSRVIIDVIDVMICSLQSVNLFLCRKLHLFLGKSTKTAATRAPLFDCNMHKIVCRQGLCLRSHWGSLQLSPDP